MITTFVIPIIDTSSGNYDFSGSLSTEEYTKMIMENFNKNYNSINDLVEYGVNNGYVETFKDKEIGNVEERYIFSKTEANITNIDNKDITTSFLDAYVNNSSKTILRVNINPSTMDGDSIVEMNYWMDDSRLILNDTRLDNKTMIMTLPYRDFLIDTGENVYRLCDCKIVELNNSKSSPFSFALLVDKIIYY
jgi:hypothetical protein